MTCRGTRAVRWAYGCGFPALDPACTFIVVFTLGLTYFFARARVGRGAVLWVVRRKDLPAAMLVRGGVLLLPQLGGRHSPRCPGRDAAAELGLRQLPYRLHGWHAILGLLLRFGEL